jgi:hypothetical protein
MEKEILQKAVQQFKTLTQTPIKILNTNNLKEKKAPPHPPTVQLTTNGIQTTFNVLLTHELRTIQLPALIEKIAKAKTDWLVVAQYIPKPLKETLKNNGINYLEVAGNCFIQKKGFFFYINDQPVTPHRQTPTGKLWKNAGLQFIFALLQQPQLLNQTYRQMAQAAHIALGNIGALLQELREEGYIQPPPKNNQQTFYLERKEALQKKWIELFITTLRPKLIKGKYRFMTVADKAHWKTMNATTTYWGGETAGALLTNYLEPERFTLYTQQPTTEIIKALRLLPDKNGEIELLHVFWNTELTPPQPQAPHIVPPLLAYAELATSLDSRNRETAERIKKQYIDQH